MRTAALVTLALGLGACSNEPWGHTWEADKDGMAIPSTKTAVWTEDDVVAIRQALTHNVVYNIDCAAIRIALSGETLVFDGINSTAECNATKGPYMNAPQNMVIPYTDPTARWKSGKSWNDQVSSMRAKPYGFVGGAGTLGMCIRLRQSAAGGDSPNWGSALWDLGTNGQLNLPSTAPFGDASFLVVRTKGVNETGCPL